jgi:hypothetical protein
MFCPDNTDNQNEMIIVSHDNEENIKIGEQKMMKNCVRILGPRGCVRLQKTYEMHIH